MKTQQLNCNFWCHSCRAEFTSNQQPGEQDIQCPTCSNIFCQLMKNTTPKYFQPYQKQPTKKENRILRISQRANPMRIIELQQIMEEEQHQKEGIEISHEELARFSRKLETDSQCSVCKEDLRAGEEYLVFACRHTFHEECLVDWLTIKNSCPTCRQKMIPTD